MSEEKEQRQQEVQKEACTICGKTLKQRKQEGYDMEPEDKMEIVDDYNWIHIICPICKDVITALSGRDFISGVEQTVSDMLCKLRIHIEPEAGSADPEK